MAPGGQPGADADDGVIEALEALVRKAVEATGVARLAHTEGVAAAASTASYGACVAALPGLAELVADGEADVRLAALRALPRIGERMTALDTPRAADDVPRALLPLLPPLALDDSDDVMRGAVLAFKRLVALLPRDAAAAPALAAIQRLEAQGTEDAAVAAARLFAQTAASWSEAALVERAPELLRRCCSHRNFTVREATACCISLVGEALPLDFWERALLPWFSQLVRDNNWRVRRAAALDLPRLAGALHRHQQRALGGGGGAACSCTAGGGAPCSGCGGGDGASLRCRTSGVAPEPLGKRKAGGCAHLASSNGGAGYGARPGDARRRHQTLASSSVWSAHVLRPPPAAGGSGGATSMGKHPLSSSLLVDAPAPACDSPKSSSSLSSSDERLPGSPNGSASPCSPLAEGGSDGEGEGACDGPVAPLQQGGAPKEQPGAGAGGDAADAGAGAGAAALDGAAARAAPSCELAREHPVLHACWAALRECVDSVTADSSHWVKVTALSGLGPCLLALPPCQVSGLLTGRFAAMGSSTTVIYEISVALACAQSFGLVASKLGPHHWADLRPAFTHLQASRDPAVLQELVASLPLVAQHLGTDVLCVDLLPSLVAIVHNHLSWVDAAFVRAAAPLLEALPQSSHEPLLRVLTKLAGGGADAERCRTWRLRRGIAAQLGRLARASARPTITDVLWPAAIALCSDPVAAVRAAAASEVGPLVAALLPLLDDASAAGSEPGSEASEQKPRARRCNGGQHDRGAGGEDPTMRKGRSRGSDADASGSSNSGSDSDGSSGPSSRPAAGGVGVPGGARAARPSAALCSPCSSASSGGGSAGFGRALSGEDCDEEDLPCALAAPAGPGFGAGEESPGAGERSEEDAPVTGALELGTSGSGGSSSSGSGGDEGGGAGAGSGSDASSSGRSRGDGSSSDSDGDVVARFSTPPLSRTPVHPAMMHPGMMHPGMMHPGMSHPAMHPAMAPVGSWAPGPRPSAPRRSTSANVLPVSRRPPPVSEAAARRRSSSSRPNLARGRSAPEAPPPAAATGLDPLTVGPGLYVDALVDRFARSPSFQGRQLYVTMSLGLLAHAAPLLSARKRALVAGALEALAGDRVSSVRVVAQGAAAALLAAAAERDGRGPEAEAGAAASAPQPEEPQQQQQKEEPGVAAAAAGAPASKQQQPQQQQQQPAQGGQGGDAAAAAPAAAAPAATGGVVQQPQRAASSPVDAALLSSQHQLLAAARALVRHPGSFEAASEALRACNKIGGGGAGAAAVVPIAILQ